MLMGRGVLMISNNPDEWVTKPINPIMQYFTYDHLPPHLQQVSKPFCMLAKDIDLLYPDGAEKQAGLRKLLEAKDCVVRAALLH